MVELEQAIDRLVGSLVPPLKTEILPLYDSLGKICEQDLFAPMDNPPFDRAEVDGYAIRSYDVRMAGEGEPIILEVIGSSFAGDVPLTPVRAGQALRVTEGAMLPDGCDCVVDAAYTDCGKKTVTVYRSVQERENLTFEGQNVARGMFVLRKYQKVAYAHVGILAGLGVTSVPVYAPLRVGILVTGSEVVEPQYPLTKGKIYNANTALLKCRLEELSMTPVDLGNVRDRVDEVSKVISESFAELDVLITTGGVSMGKRDLMGEVYRKLGITPFFKSVNFCPGTVTHAGLWRQKLILSLAGSPATVLTTFELLVRPVLAKLGRDPSILTGVAMAAFRGVLPGPFPVRTFLHGIYENGQVILPPGKVGANQLLMAASSNCLIDIPAGQSEPGQQRYRVVLLDPMNREGREWPI